MSEFIPNCRKTLKSHPVTDAAYRITVGIVGSLVVIVGLILVPLPGPGWALVILGLLILSTEFEKAQRVLGFARHWINEWIQWVARQRLWVRLSIGLLTLLFVAAILYITALNVGVPSWVPGVLVPPLPGLEYATSW